MITRILRGLGFFLLLAAATLPLAAAPQSGAISGVVVDLRGTPQMGATVLVSSERLLGSGTIELLTNDRGHFSSASLVPGFYSVHVTLAGFLPAIEQHIRVEARRTTLLQIELGTIFASLDRLRRQPNQTVDSEDWAWVLRTSADTRPILRWNDGEVTVAGQQSPAERARNHQPRGRIELTSGARHPGSMSNLADSPSTSFAYEQSIGSVSRLLLAGQFSYERATPSGGFATVWLPAGDAAHGSVTSLVLRQSRLGSGGPSFRGMRMSHDDRVALGDRLRVRYGAEFLMAGLGTPTSSLRPRGEIALELSPTWRAALILAARPWLDSEMASNPLQSALDSLDAFPTLMIHNGRSVLESGWHQELAVEHDFNPKTSLIAAVFHDRSRNTAVFGRGASMNADFLQDYFSDAFVYDGGDSGSWGTRLVYRQKLSDHLEAEAVYARAGALAPETTTVSSLNLRDFFETRYRNSLAGRVSSRLPRTNTQISASYKWISGAAVSRQDPYGESTYRLDPNLNLTVRQPLPGFIPGHLMALADFGNLLAQGYVPITTRDGRVLLVPAYRSFRGGVSLQF